MTSIRAWLIALGLLSFTAACAGPTQNSRSYRSARRPLGYSPGLVVVDGTPPPLRYEAVPFQPYDDAYWIPGYWDWAGGDWIWIPGHWEVAPPGYVWIGPNYSTYGSYCEYTPGSWQPSREEQRPREQAPRPDYPRNDTARTADRPAPPPAQPITINPRSRPTYTTTPPTSPPTRFDPARAKSPDFGPAAPPSRVIVQPQPQLQPSRRNDFGSAPLPAARIAPPAANTYTPSRVAPRAPAFNPPRAAAPSVRTNPPAFAPSAAPAAKQSSKPVQTYTPAPMKSSAKPSKK